MTTSEEVVARIARAIAEAGQHRPYGLYDYSGYPGESPPHVVRDERTGERLLITGDRDKAEEYWRKLSQEYVAHAAIAAWNTRSPAQAERVRELEEALRVARRYVDAVIANSPDKKKQRNYGECLQVIDAALRGQPDNSLNDTRNPNVAHQQRGQP